MISTILRASALAAATGERIMAPAAVLSWAAVSGRVTFKQWPFSLLGRPWAMKLLWLSAVGEIAVDKLPFTPTRTNPGPLFGRVVSGAGVSAAQFSAEGRSAALGGVLGAAVAAAQTFATHTVRVRLNESLPNPISGSVGDLMTLAYALGAVSSKKRRRI